MKARIFDKASEYLEVVEWWKKHGWAPVPVEYLPAIGIVIEDDKHKYCVGWLYLMGAPIAWMEWIVTNPNAPAIRRAKALSVLVDTVLNIAKDSGVKVVFSSVKHEGLEGLYKKKGFSVTDTDVTHLIARLN